MSNHRHARAQRNMGYLYFGSEDVSNISVQRNLLCELYMTRVIEKTLSNVLLLLGQNKKYVCFRSPDQPFIYRQTLTYCHFQVHIFIV